MESKIQEILMVMEMVTATLLKIMEIKTVVPMLVTITVTVMVLETLDNPMET